MNRVIKFKAWHKILKCWFNEIALYSDGMAGMSVDAFEKQLPSKYQLTGDEVIETDEESSFRCTILTGDDWIFLDSIELCQFTGLYDKNGKEVFESNIVKCHDHPTNIESGIFQVYFERGCFRAGNMTLCDWGHSWIEVIGDKYSNPEILK